MLFFRVTRSVKSDNRSAFHGSLNPGNRSFGYFSRPLLEGYLDFQNQYRLIAKSLAVAEVNPLLQGISAFVESTCILEQKYKRGVFEAVFSRKLRLVPKARQSDWAAFKLRDFATRITRKNNGATDIPLTISAQYGLIDQRDFFSKVVASTDMSEYYLLRQGEYAYNRSTSNDYPFGSIKRLELYNEGAVSPLYLCFAIKEKVVLSDFAKWYFESSQWHRGINEICAEGARNHGLLNVPIDGFFNTVHILPCDIEEQARIAAFLSQIHDKLTQAQEELEKLNSMRNGLMQQLFI